MAARSWIVPLAFAFTPIGVSAQDIGVFKDRRKAIAELQQQNPESAAAIERGLAWLASAQSGNGRWSDRGSDVSTTALAVLAFLAADESAPGSARASNAMRGLRWLESRQARDGWIGSRRSGLGTYEHGLATAALIEAFALQPSPRLRSASQAALDAMLRAPNDDGGWGFTAWESHTSVVGLVAVVIRTAEDAGLRVGTLRYDDQARKWFERCFDEKSGQSKASPQGPRANVPWHPATSAQATSASSLLGQLMIRRAASPRSLVNLADTIVANAPLWREGRADLDAWFVSSQALYLMGGRHWKQWRLGLEAALVESQRRDGKSNGSWDPAGIRGPHGSRSRATALATLSLLAPTRYTRSTGGTVAKPRLIRADEPSPDPVVEEGYAAGGKFGSRGRGRAALTRKSGKPVANAIQSGLVWLKNHQSPDGSWRSAGFHAQCPETDRCSGVGNAINDIGVTGLALLAFLGDGSTLRVGPYKDVVKKGIVWLTRQQGNDGLIGNATTRAFAYNHAIATLALVEAYGLSRYKILEKPSQRAIDYIAKARNPYKVWRYYPRDGSNDTSVTSWMVFALRSARDFKLDIDDRALKFALAWLDEVTDPATGAAGYTKRGEGSSREIDTAAKFPTNKTEALTAAGLLCRIWLGQTPNENPVLKTAADRMLQKPPRWDAEDGSVDLYYWFYGSYAMYQMGGRYWKEWRKHLQPALLDTQNKYGHATGSWTPQSAWSGQGGRVYATAMSVLCLEVYYRYTRLVR